MTKYILAKGVKPDKNTVKVEDYLIGELITTTESQGYLKKEECDSSRDFGRIRFSNNKIISHGDIIIKNTPALKARLLAPKAVEFLTGIELDLLSYRLDFTKRLVLTRSSSNELDTFVHIFLDRHPTVEQLWEYIQNHQDIEEYKKQLETLKAQGNLRHLVKQRKEAEAQAIAEQEKLSIRRIG